MTNLIIKKPIITEKSMADAARGVFTFEITKLANKHQVKTAVEQAFKVNVQKITTLTRKSTQRKTGKRNLPSTNKARKIARVWLKEGQKIDIFELKDKDK